MQEVIIGAHRHSRGVPGKDAAAGAIGITTEPVLRMQRRRPPALLDIVVPALNEELRIGATLRAVMREVEATGISARLIVVDNGSQDGTAEVVHALALRSDLRIDLISCSERGKGAAVRAGVLHSRAQYVAYIDADLSTPPTNLSPALRMLQEGTMAVIGSRRASGARVEVPQSYGRRMGSRVFNLAAQGLVGAITDTQCGFKMFDGVLARSVFKSMRIDGYAFDVEVIARVVRSGVLVAELPVVWSDDPGTRLRPVGDGARAFRDLMQVRRILRSEGPSVAA